MVLYGANSLQQQNQQSVVPSDHVITLAKQLAIVLLAEVVSLTACLILGGIWVIFPICSCGCAYYSIKDRNSFKPNMLLMFFNFNVFGTALGFATWAISLSKVIGPRNPESYDYHMSAVPALVAWTIALIILVVANRMAWVTYKNMLSCPMALNSIGYIGGAGSRGGYDGEGGPGYATSFAGGGSSTQYSNSGMGYQPQSQGPSFQPFQGQGHRLGA